MDRSRETSILECVQPVAIGAVGGSGTRIVAGFLRELGYFIGSDLNHANDNLAFTRKFKTPSILAMADCDFSELATTFVDEMETGRRLLGAPRWAWKEPNTQIVVDRLCKLIPRLRYIHVIRNGLDMAHSSNQNQPRLWGSHFLGGEPQEIISPRYSLKYWCAVQRRMFEIAEESEFRGRFFFLNYDDLCMAPMEELERLFRFLDVEYTEGDRKRMAALVAPPTSIGRWRTAGLDVFDPEDVEYVVSLGFRI